MTDKDLIIVGGGPAGLAAAAAAREAGIEDILIIERDSRLGGILNQCIHNGFGLHTFKEELTGPEYAARYEDKVKELEIPFVTDTMVLEISGDKRVTTISREKGLVIYKAGAVILAMGCRERPRGALNIPGMRPAGIYTAGTAQRLVNIEGRLPGREVVILGSGDIGLIMARRMTLEGAKVKMVAELMPYSGGLKRNIVQCLDDFGIPLKLSHTVVDIEGKDRVSAVTVAAVDENLNPVPGSEERIPCDTLLLSCGLLPENELSIGAGVSLSPVTGGAVVDEKLETTVPGIFSCGNVLHVHDLVDYVSEEAAMAGVNAAEYILKMRECGGAADSDGAAGGVCAEDGSGADADAGNAPLYIKTEGGVRYSVPSLIHPAAVMNMLDEPGAKLKFRFRVGRVLRNCYVDMLINSVRVIHKKRPVVSPGEMEEIILTGKQLDMAFAEKENETISDIVIRLSEEG